VELADATLRAMTADGCLTASAPSALKRRSESTRTRQRKQSVHETGQEHPFR
jgi:hypothetical protein